MKKENVNFDNGSDLRSYALELVKTAKEQFGVSQDEIALSIFVSSATISQVLNGTGEYGKGANPIPTLGKIISFIESNYIKSRPTPQDSFQPNLVKSKDFLLSVKTIKDAIDNRQMAVLVGVAGTGKTYSINYMLDKYPNMVYVRVEEKGGLKFLVQQLAVQLNMDPKGNSSELIYSIINKYKKAKTVLVFDEAHRLTKTMLESLRAFNDVGGFTIIYSGTRPLMEKLTGKDQNDRQLLRRIKLMHEFLAPENFPTHNERKELIKKIIVDGYGLADVSNVIIEQLFKRTKGYFGDVVTYLSQAKMKATQKNMELTEDLILRSLSNSAVTSEHAIEIANRKGI